MEVYPAAALKGWGLPHRGYKGRSNMAALGNLVDALRGALPGLDWGGVDTAARTSDHVLDAVVCALIARAARLGCTTGPAPEVAAQARTEGWIHLPTCSLEELLRTMA
jgi:hypothetical protein